MECVQECHNLSKEFASRKAGEDPSKASASAPSKSATPDGSGSTNVSTGVAVLTSLDIEEEPDPMDRDARQHALSEIDHIHRFSYSRELSQKLVAEVLVGHYVLFLIDAQTSRLKVNDEYLEQVQRVFTEILQVPSIIHVAIFTTPAHPAAALASVLSLASLKHHIQATSKIKP